LSSKQNLFLYTYCTYRIVIKVYVVLLTFFIILSNIFFISFIFCAKSVSIYFHKIYSELRVFINI